MAKKHRSAAQKAATRKMLAKRHRRYRRNPAHRAGRFTVQGFMQHTLMPSVMGAAGALGINMAIGFLPLPPMMKTGPMRTLTTIVGAAAIGAVASNFVKRETAQQAVAGAITISLYNLLVGYMPANIQAMTVGENDATIHEYPSIGYAGAGYTVDGNTGAYVDSGVGLYVGDSPVDSGDNY